ncbi:MAG: VOC family protein [Gaiellaceae bacterium]
MTANEKPRLLGLNHIAIEVGDLGEALDFYGRMFEFSMRNRFERMAWIDLGDQFIALSVNPAATPDGDRHFGLVVDSKEDTRRAMEAAGVEALPGRGLRFRDPWGNQVEIVDYKDVQYTKAPAVLAGMGIEEPAKTAEAREELRGKGLLDEGS